jgi:nitroreductase
MKQHVQGDLLMEYSELIANRYSVRAYKPDLVEVEKLQKVLEAARLAPTACNRQAFQIIVIQTKGRKEELHRIYKPDWFIQAPLILCMCAVPAQGWVRSSDQRRYLDLDLGIVMDHLVLEATNQGLGTCWVADFNPDAVRRILELPNEIEPMIFTPLGYAADAPGLKKRKPLSDLVRYERW